MYTTSYWAKNKKITKCIKNHKWYCKCVKYFLQKKVNKINFVQRKCLCFSFLECVFVILQTYECGFFVMLVSVIIVDNKQKLRKELGCGHIRWVRMQVCLCNQKQIMKIKWSSLCRGHIPCILASWWCTQKFLNKKKNWLHIWHQIGRLLV